jgi:hypothetical protein
MLGLLFEGTIQTHFAFWLLLFFSGLCMAILLRTIWIHFRQNRWETRMSLLSEEYSNLVKMVRYGVVGDEAIREVVRPREFLYFQRYLQDTISTTTDIDVMSESKIAEVTGFRDFLNKRIERKRGWNKAIALRTLSYFRDSRNAPVFLHALSHSEKSPEVYAAGYGLALAKQVDTFNLVAQKVWVISNQNTELLWNLLLLFGESTAPNLLRLLREGLKSDDAMIVAIALLGRYRYTAAVTDFIKILEDRPPPPLAGALLAALGKIADKQSIGPILAYLNHPDFTVRVEALKAVAGIGDPESCDQVETLLVDDNWWVRREAANSLAVMGQQGIDRLQSIASRGNGVAWVAAKGVLAEQTFNRTG